MILSLLASILALQSGPALKNQVSDAAVGEYASCLVRYHANAVAKALDSGFDGRFDSALAAVSTAKCEALTASSPRLLRSHLFAAMYRRFGPQAGRTASNVARNWLPKLPVSDERYGWYVLSACLVQHEPDATRAMVRAKDWTDANLPGRIKVVNALPVCLPAGAQIRINVPTLAGFIAETIYQIDFATSPGDRKRFNA